MSTERRGPTCPQCGTRFRRNRRGCPRGPACAAEAAEWARLTKLAERRDTQDHR